MRPTANSIRFFLAALAALALTACAGVPGADTSGQTQVTPPARAATTRSAAPRRTYSVADLMGADTTKVDGILGPPDIVRREGAGEMRIYRNTGCVVHVFLFPRAGQLSATHVEARANAARLDDRQAGACISSFT